VIYTRYSSNSQTVQSIEGQLKICREYAKRNEMTIIKEYIEEAITGTTDNRPVFQKMIEDSNKQAFTGILVYQPDRFARNRYDSAIYKSKLKKNGVRVYSAKENISDDASGILVEGLLESMAEYYSAELSQKIRRGMEINASKGKATGGNVALGYKLDENRRFIVDEEAASVVRMVFEMYANGHSIVRICEYLNNKGFKTSRGAEFNKNSLRLMLRNKRYIGIYTYKGEETDVSIPRIVSDELFEQVAVKLEKNQKAPARAKAKAEYLLTTKLFCGHCREMMTGESGTSKTGKVHHYYKCVLARKKQCSKKPVKKAYIEDLVIAQCRLLTDENIDKITKEVVALCEREQASSELKRLGKLLKEVERKKANMINAIAECDMADVRKSLYEHLHTLESERENIEIQIAKEQISQVTLTEPEIKFFLTQLRKGNVNDEKYRSTLINVFVNAVYLYDDKVTIIFNSSDQPVTVEQSLVDEIEASNREFESSYLGKDAPPNL
ncbi:recombinase family protein, partial [Paenibacillus sp. J5C_2022]|uniref:recombinase family protein n=1 Tax=Paenibacillus sp. J5C2022 TaxID=2977129 RepID=UPI0021D2ABF0